MNASMLGPELSELAFFSVLAAPVDLAVSDACAWERVSGEQHLVMN